MYLTHIYADPEAAVTELQKRVEKLETEKLELIKVCRNLHAAAPWYISLQSSLIPCILQSLSAAHLLAASSSSTTTPAPQQQHTGNTSAVSRLRHCMLLHMDAILVY